MFGNNHGFELWQVGLSFIGIFVGMMLGISSDLFWRKNYARLVRDYNAENCSPASLPWLKLKTDGTFPEQVLDTPQHSEPEFRLPPTILGAWVVPIAMFGE